MKARRMRAHIKQRPTFERVGRAPPPHDRPSISS